VGKAADGISAFPARDHPVAGSDHPGRAQDYVSGVELQRLAEGFLGDVQTALGFGSRISFPACRQSQESSNGKPGALSPPTAENTTPNFKVALERGAPATGARAFG
jgi:hypothetical protein